MGANFTPTFGAYRPLAPFRYWCQKVLPLTYDDSLSYYELLNKVVDYLNKTMEDVETLHDDVDAMLAAFNALQTYVNTYFDELDLTEEVQTVLDRMAENGSLDELLRPIVGDQIGGVVAEQIDNVVASQIYNTVAEQINNAVATVINGSEILQNSVEGWLNEHVATGDIVVDDTLSIAGAAADSSTVGSAVGRHFSILKNYIKGDYVLYNGGLYRFTENHDAGAWTGTDATPVEITGEVDDINTKLKMIETPQIVGMRDTGISIVSSNLFQYAVMIGYHKVIYSISNGKVVLSDATSSNTYLIPVDGVNTYTFTFCRTAVVVSDTDLTAVGIILNNVKSINSVGGKFIVFSFNTTTYPESSYEITKPVDKYKVPENWDFIDVKVHTPQIDGMLPTGRNVKSSNLFPNATLVYTGKYVDRIVDGKAYFSDSTNLDTYLIPVDGNTTYSFTNCRTALLVSDLEYTAVGSVLSYVTEIDTTGAAYVLFSFNRTTYPVDSYVITHPVEQYAIPADWYIQTDSKNQYQVKSGSIENGGSIALTGKTAVKFGQRIVFKGFISSFNEIKLAFNNYNDSLVINSISVDGTNIYVYNGATAVRTWEHGLTVSHDISLVVDYLKDEVQITFESNGSIYKNTATWGDLTSGVASVSAVSTGTVCTSAILIMAIPETLKPVWYFGDSYISHTNKARWTYYLLDYGFDKGTLLNGYAGGTSATTVMALTALLGYGTPKFAVFGTGMNDGNDTSSAPSTNWTNAKNNFLALCENNGITPIFCTIPTVTSVNNEQKNAWVRASGYRYIDFASAVGAQSDGTWYADMLSSDNVHPTEKGAIALFTQAISDFPEFVAE